MMSHNDHIVKCRYVSQIRMCDCHSRRKKKTEKNKADPGSTFRTSALEALHADAMDNDDESMADSVSLHSCSLHGLSILERPDFGTDYAFLIRGCE
jgi:hypothetical protein